LEIYLDNCSTTQPREEVVEEIIYALRKEYGNPSSLHKLGLQAEIAMEKARETIADFLKVSKEEIFFTSGGTESNNIAIQSIISKYNRIGKHIITTLIEHSSVYNVYKFYEEQGFEVTYLKVNERGIISLEELEKAIREDTILISIMQVNNEIGSIQPTWKIKELIKKKNSKALLHVDGVQAFGKIKLNIKDWGIDTFSISGHKIYGPKGIGVLYIDKNLKINPIIYGGNQERGLRSGTENIPGIIGLGKAVEILHKNFDQEQERVKEIKTYFIKRLKEEIDHIHINSPLEEDFSPYILNVSFDYVRGEVLLHYLENKGIYVSTASACSSKGVKENRVLKAIGFNERYIEGAIRFCFSYKNTKEDIDYTIEALKESVKEIRQITMR